jgi:hypothetical protein
VKGPAARTGAAAARASAGDGFGTMADLQTFDSIHDQRDPAATLWRIAEALWNCLLGRHHGGMETYGRSYSTAA